MEDIHKTIERHFEQIYNDYLNEELKSRTDLICSQRAFLQGFAIRTIITYMQCKLKTGGIDTPYSIRTKGSCVMILYLCKQFGYLSEEQIKQYMKIVTR